MKKHILSYILIVLGGTMTAAAFGLFILPQNFVAGGVTGLSSFSSMEFPCRFPGLCLESISCCLSLAGFLPEKNLS